MITIRNPKRAPAPATYHHGVEVSGSVRTLYVAGQIALRPDGTVPDGIAAQSALVFDNMRAVLDEAGMTFAHVVKMTVYLLNRADRAEFSRVRDAVFGETKTASTLLYISGLARPELLLEVEAIAVADS